MAKKNNRDWKELLPAIGLISLVLGVLAMTAMVKTDLDPGAVGKALEGVDRPARLTHASTRPGLQETSPAPSSETSRKSGTLEDRARDDYQRLTGMQRRWTSQLMLSCDPENSLRHLIAVNWDDNLYVLPAELKGQTCFRLCWGLYDSREQAIGDRDIHPHLAREFPKRHPKQLAEIRP